VSLGPETPEQTAASTVSLEHGQLPFRATERLNGMRANSSWTSNLSMQEFAAVRSVGFDPVGQVTGVCVMKLSYTGYGGCGMYPRYTGRRPYGRGPRVTRIGTNARNSWSGVMPLIEAMYSARRDVISRLEQECAVLGGDGVVGVRLRMAPFAGGIDTMEFQAVGTAVRGTGSRHLGQPFTSVLAGQDFAKLLMSGWMPCGLVFGVAVGVRHDDCATQRARRSWSNVEIPGYTELVQQTRAQVRHEIHGNLARMGGKGLVTRPMRLRIREQECRNLDSGGDHLAEASMVGTALVPFRRGVATEVPPPLRILRLDQEHEEVLGPRPIGVESKGPTSKGPQRR